jgi:excinuclease ABC subunit A
MRAADRVVDLGPGAGREGGRILAQGTAEEVMACPDSPTGAALRAPLAHPMRGARRPVGARGKGAPEGWIELRGAALRNLRGFDLRIPRGRLTVVAGVSGAGKSTLMSDLLAPVARHALARGKDGATGAEGAALGLGKSSFRSLAGLAGLRQLVVVDQDPIGKTPRSTPATYIGAWDLVRERLAKLPEAALRGAGPGFFSFNTEGGRCEACAGAGRARLEMSFLPETYVPCEACGGSRFGPVAASLRWDGRSAADILALTFAEAEQALGSDIRLREMCGLMNRTGLGYLTLGQSSPTLSGGEAQRLKLVTELIRGLPTFAERARGKVRPNLYLLEEPSIGLHPADIRRLLGVLHDLVDQGHTVVVIEHHPDILAEADWLVEIGPEGGAGGGRLLHQGPPEGLLRVAGSPTAPALASALRMGLESRGASLVRKSR